MNHMKNTKFCENCGAEIDIMAEICPKCGVRIRPHRKPGTAALLSLLWTGAGQIYNGEIAKGILLIVLQGVNILLMFVIVGFFTYPIVWIWGIYDAYKNAKESY